MAYGSGRMTVAEIRDRSYPVFKRFNIKKAYLFGSYAKNLADEESDIDLRIDMGQDSKIDGMFALARFKSELQTALQKPIDIITYLSENVIDRGFADEVRESEIAIYGD